MAEAPAEAPSDISIFLEGWPRETSRLLTASTRISGGSTCERLAHGNGLRTGLVHQFTVCSSLWWMDASSHSEVTKRNHPLEPEAGWHYDGLGWQIHLKASTRTFIFDIASASWRQKDGILEGVRSKTYGNERIAHREGARIHSPRSSFRVRLTSGALVAVDKHVEMQWLGSDVFHEDDKDGTIHTMKRPVTTGSSWVNVHMMPADLGDCCPFPMINHTLLSNLYAPPGNLYSLFLGYADRRDMRKFWWGMTCA